MQVFVVRGLELDRCGACGRVWLDLDEVDRAFGVTALVLSQTEIDVPCPRGHGPLVQSTVRGRGALACPICRGALVEGHHAPAPEGVPPTPKRVPLPDASEVRVSCDVCLKSVPLSDATNTVGGICCRKCELEPPPRKYREGITGEGLVNVVDIAQAVLELLFSIHG